jgi:hypothetical protein
MIHIGLLHIATAATLGDDAGMIGAFHHYAAVSAEVVVNVPTALGVVQRGDFSIRPLGNRAAIPGLDGGLVLRVIVLFPPVEPVVPLPKVEPVVPFPPPAVDGWLVVVAG